MKIIGDIPIFVAPDSVDAWTNRNLLKIDENGNQEASSGVPPDAFSSTGQLWGNPLYRWSEHEKTGFAWWISRLKETLKLCDIVRIDHFRGLAACWEVPSGEETAINGKWVKSPGRKLLEAAKEALGGELPIIAEDLGVITDDVIELRDGFGLPGMKILQFAFARNEEGELDADNPYLPHNIGRDSIVYTGTHDNNTSVGWYSELSDEDKDLVRRYFECPDDQTIWQMIRHMMMTNAKYADVQSKDTKLNIYEWCNPLTYRLGSDFGFCIGKYIDLGLYFDFTVSNLVKPIFFNGRNDNWNWCVGLTFCYRFDIAKKH